MRHGDPIPNELQHEWDQLGVLQGVSIITCRRLSGEVRVNMAKPHQWCRASQWRLMPHPCYMGVVVLRVANYVMIIMVVRYICGRSIHSTYGRSLGQDPSCCSNGITATFQIASGVYQPGTMLV